MQHNKNQIDKIAEAQEAEQKRQAEIADNMQKVCKQAFSGTNGKYLGKFMKDICLWADVKNDQIDVNQDVLAYQKGRRDVWLIIREFIDKKDLAEIEIYD